MGAHPRASEKKSNRKNPTTRGFRAPTPKRKHPPMKTRMEKQHLLSNRHTMISSNNNEQKIQEIGFQHTVGQMTTSGWSCAYSTYRDHISRSAFSRFKVKRGASQKVEDKKR